jgi:hypothetical protein
MVKNTEKLVAGKDATVSPGSLPQPRIKEEDPIETIAESKPKVLVGKIVEKKKEVLNPDESIQPHNAHKFGDPKNHEHYKKGNP